MRSNRGASDIVTVLAIATLCFSILGIAAGSMQFLAYDETPQVPPWKAPAEVKVPLVDETAGTGTTEPVPPDGGSGPPPLPPDGGGAPKPDEPAKPGPDDGKTPPLPGPEF